MAVRNKTQFATLYGSSGTLFPDNTTGEISEADVRSQGEDIKDSFVNWTDGVSPTGLADYAFGGYVPSSASIGAFRQAGLLPTASILTANSVPIELISAQGAGTVIVPIAIFFYMDYNSVAYATNTNFRLEINGVAMTGTNSTMLVSTADSFALLKVSDFSTSTTLENQPLVFEVQTGDPTAGNSNIYYELIYRLMAMTI